MAQARSTRAINQTGKKLGFVTYSTDTEDEVSKIFIMHVSLLCDEFETTFIHAERLQISDTCRKQTCQFARFNTQRN